MALEFKSEFFLILDPRRLLYFLVSNPPNDVGIILVAFKIGAVLENDMKWQLFGMYLLGTTERTELTQIEQKYPDKGLRCRDLLDLWKERNDHPKWEQVIQVLKRCDLHRLATELEEALRRPEITIPDQPFSVPPVNEQDTGNGKIKIL